MKSYLDERDKQELKKAKEFKDLLPIALRVISRVPAPVGEVCGPMTSGGFGSTEANFRLFRAVIDRLSRRLNIFDQMPFEGTMSRIFKAQPAHTHDGDIRLLEEFYLPIFQSGLVSTLYFMPNWRTSRGARWERRNGRKLGLGIINISWEELGINPESFRPR